MAGFNMDEPITLAGIGAEEDFKEAMEKLVPLIGKGEKGSVTIKIELARPADYDSILNLVTTVTNSAPAPKKRKSMARLGDGKVYIETAEEAQMTPVLTLFQNEAM